MMAHSLFLLLLEATVSYCTVDYPGYVILHLHVKVRSTLTLLKHETIQQWLCT